MDESRFDGFTRALAGGVSRRGALTLLLGGAVAGIRAVAGHDAVAAQEAARKPAGFERLGKRCDGGQPCGIHTPCDGTYCRPAKCWIDGQVIDDRDINDDYPCLRCVALEHNGAWARWSHVRDGTTCPPGDSGNPCHSTFIATCQDGDCVPDQLPDGTECGPEQTCCRGECCAAGVTCDPETGCGTCDPANGDARREDGSCAPGCTIGNVFYEPYARNPGNDCEECAVSASTTAWTPIDFGGCGENGDRFCASGVCCDLGICPDLATYTCGDYCDAVCVIGGTMYYNGDRNPANGCEVCGSHVDHTAWSLVAPNYYCDPDALTGACCEGTCCNPGYACSHEGACIPLDS